MSTLIELQVLAKQRGLRGFRKHSKRKLCELLKIEYTGDVCIAIPVILKNILTGETQRLPSISKVAITLNKNPGSIAYYINTGKPMKVNECQYTLSKEKVL